MPEYARVSLRRLRCGMVFSVCLHGLVFVATAWLFKSLHPPTVPATGQAFSAILVASAPKRAAVTPQVAGPTAFAEAAPRDMHPESVLPAESTRTDSEPESPDADDPARNVDSPAAESVRIEPADPEPNATREQPPADARVVAKQQPLQSEIADPPAAAAPATDRSSPSDGAERETESTAAQPRPAEFAAAAPNRGSDARTGASRPAAPAAGNPKPRYPQIAVARGYEGSVVLEVSVQASGEVAEVTVKRSSGFKILDKAALAAIKRWRFVPAVVAGREVDAVAEVPVVFRLLDRRS